MNDPIRATTFALVMGLTLIDVSPPAVAREPAVPVAEASNARRLPGNQRIFYSSVAANTRGQVVVAGKAIDGRTVVWTSQDHGKTFSKPQFALPREDTSTSHKDVRLQSDDGGAFYLSIGARRSKSQPGTGGFLWKSDDGGTTWMLLHRSFDDEDTDLALMAVSPDGNQLIHAVPGVNQVKIFSSHDRGENWSLSVLTASSSGMLFDAVVDDNGRTVVVSREREWPSTWRFDAATTQDDGATWKRHKLGLIGECMPEAPERYAVVDGIYHSGAALDDNGAGQYFLISIEREWTRQGERAHTRVRSSQDGEHWSEPDELSNSADGFKAFPAISASGPRVHVLWLEANDEGWANLVHRGSLDAGKTWSDPIVISKTDQPTSLLTTHGFRRCASHFFESNMDDDGIGTAHVVWGAGSRESWEGEPWHTTVRLRSGP